MVDDELRLNTCKSASIKQPLTLQIFQKKLLVYSRRTFRRSLKRNGKDTITNMSNIRRSIDRKGKYFKKQ